MYPYLAQQALATKNAAFLIILLDEGKNKGVRAIMVNRHDGLLGFPGGKLEGNETPLEAMVRECKEEIDFDVTPYLDKVRWLCSNKIASHMNSHAFFLEVSEVVFNKIVLNAAIHLVNNNFIELSGITAPTVFNVTEGKVVSLTQDFGAATVYEELTHLIYNVLQESNL